MKKDMFIFSCFLGFTLNSQDFFEDILSCYIVEFWGLGDNNKY